MLLVLFLCFLLPLLVLPVSMAQALDAETERLEAETSCQARPYICPGVAEQKAAEREQAEQARQEFLRQGREALQRGAQEAKRSRQLAQRNMLWEVQQAKRPQNYRAQIDAKFVATLKDPDSRKIAYRSLPYGSLVCGTINARNSFGGYTGQQPFLAYFGPNGRLAWLEAYSDETLRSMRTLPSASEYFYYPLMRDCGFV